MGHHIRIGGHDGSQRCEKHFAADHGIESEVHSVDGNAFEPAVESNRRRWNLRNM